jgi:seryl-tRNA synthetase
MKDIEKEYCTFLEKKLAQFKQYQSFTEKIKHAICGREKNKEIIGLIARRQTCIGAIEKINASMRDIIKKGSNGLLDIPKKYKSMVDSTMSSIKDIMIQIELMDKELIAIAVERRDGIKTELLNMQDLRQAARGYKSYARYPARFLDTRR